MYICTATEYLVAVTSILEDENPPKARSTRAETVRRGSIISTGHV